MGFIDGLLADKNFIVNSLVSLIEEERNRIVSHGLIEKDSCDKVLCAYIQKTASYPGISLDEVISQLSFLYESMQNVKFAGDRILDSRGKESLDKNKISEMLLQLDQIAYKFGSAGKHKIAFELENIIKTIKAEIGE